MKAIEDKLSDYLDDELPADERAEVEAHLADCADCARTLAELQQVVATASALPPRVPPSDLWNGVAERIGRSRPGPRRFSFTLPELMAASVVLAMLSGGAVALLLKDTAAQDGSRAENQLRQTGPGAAAGDLASPPGLEPADSPVDAVPAIGYADAQYDAAVADLERALENGRGRLDEATISVVEQNLSIIDRAIAEARSALGADPSNSYLSGHLMEARRRKLDLLRRAALLTDAN